MQKRILAQYDRGSYVMFVTNELSIASTYWGHKLCKLPKEKMLQTVTENDIVTGSISYVEDALRKLGKKVPDTFQPHVCVPSFVKRKLEKKTLGEIRTLYNQFPYFIKPYNSHKLFDGCIIRNNYADLYHLRKFPDSTEVLWSEYVEYLSEFRVFVHKRRCVGVRFYKGDYFVFPPKDFYFIVKSAIEEFGDKQPVAYCIDFGTKKDGTVEVIEINDGYAFGSYGLSAQIVMQMVFDRWEEMMEK
jgi:hypothetical protein